MNTVRAKVLLIGTLFIICSDVRSNSLTDIYEKALKNNQTIGAAEFLVSASREKVNASKAQMLPTISSGIGSRYSDMAHSRYSENTFSIDQEDKTNSEEVYGEIAVVQTLFDLQKRSNIRTTKIESAIRKMELENQRGLLANEVVVVYFSVVKNFSVLEVANETERALTHGLISMQQKMNEGLGIKSAISESSSALAMQKAHVSAAKSALKYSFDELTEIAGEEISQVYMLKDNQIIDETPKEDEQYWMAESKENSIEIKLAELGVRHAESQYKETKARGYPKLVSDLSYRNAEVDTRHLYASGHSDRDLGYSFHVTLTIPLFDPQLGSEKRQLLHTKSHFESIKSALSRKIEGQAASLLFKLKSNSLSAKLASESVQHSKDALQSDTVRYRAGLIEYRNVIESIQNLAAARIFYIDTVYEYIITYVSFRQLTGGLRKDDISKLNAYLDKNKVVYSQ